MPGKHYTINDWTRSVAYKLASGQTSRCDNRLTHGWYRFTSKAGGTIPNSCPPANSCGKSATDDQSKDGRYITFVDQIPTEVLRIRN